MTTSFLLCYSVSKPKINYLNEKIFLNAAQFFRLDKSVFILSFNFFQNSTCVFHSIYTHKPKI